MTKVLVWIMILQGVLLSATVETIEVKGVKVPLVFEKDSTLPIASMELVFTNSGSIEDGSKYGIAAFTASLLNEGTKKLGSVGFAEKLEENAIHIGANRGNETFSIELSSLKEQFDIGVGYFADLLSDPNFSKESFEKIKLLKLAAIDKKESDFDYIAKLGLKSLLYKNTPIANPAIGTKESLGQLKLEDIENFYKSHLVLQRTVVVIGGDLSLAEAKSKVEKVLSTLAVGKAATLVTFVPSAKAETKEIDKETQQAYVYFGAPFSLAADDNDTFKAKVAGFILGSGGFGSRLMEEVRVKRGLAYSAYGRINLNRSHSEFSGHLQTKLESQADAIKLVKEVIADFVKNGVTEDELDQAKKFIIGSEPLRNETLSQRLNRTFMEYYKGLEIGHSVKELEKIKKLTLKELNQFIKAHDEINQLSFAIVTKK
ncbi:MAG: insulinase family protein [Epsilonproteobacteria bacterium]|nr:insulinase family protein [Campylobacterota bacterium]